jgi:lysozyme
VDQNSQVGPLRLTGPRIRHMSDRGLDWLAKLEGGYVLKAYADRAAKGIPTIGPGLTYLILPGGRRRVTLDDKFDSIESCRAMYRRVVSETEVVVDACTRDDINQQEWDALTALCHNIGEPQFKGSTCIQLFNARATAAKVVEALKKWKFADGKPVLVERRRVEGVCFLEGRYILQGEK